MSKIKKIKEMLENEKQKTTIDCSKMFELLCNMLKFRENRIMIVDDEEFCISAMKALFDRLEFDYEKICDFCISG
jgi:hypothetical protein